MFDYFKNYLVSNSNPLENFNRACQYYLTGERMLAKFKLDSLNESVLISTIQRASKQKKNPSELLNCLIFTHWSIQKLKNINQPDSIATKLIKLVKNAQPNKNSILKKQKIRSISMVDNLMSANFFQKENKDKENNGSQQYLLTKIVKPYLNYISKLYFLYDFYQQFTKNNKILSDEESWIVINLFRLMGQLIGNFENLGRYYKKQYQNYVIAISQCLQADISSIYPKLKNLIVNKLLTFQNDIKKYCQMYSFQKYYIKFPEQNIEAMIKLLQEIGNINDQLLMLYHCRYFHNCVKYLKPPQWIQIYHKRYDPIYQIWKIKQKRKINKSLQETRVTRCSSKCESMEDQKSIIYSMYYNCQ